MAKSPFTGRWRIVSMTTWNEEFIDAEVEAFIEFDATSGGEFHFGCVHGGMDCQITTRNGAPAVEWTWEGNDETALAQGRGWAVLKGDELHGKFSFDDGDDSEFVAKKPGEQLRSKKKKP